MSDYPVGVWIAAPVGGWSENPVPGRTVEAKFRDPDYWRGGDMVSDTWHWPLITRFRLTDANPQQEASAGVTDFGTPKYSAERAIENLRNRKAQQEASADWRTCSRAEYDAMPDLTSAPQQEGASLPGGEGLKPCPMCGSGNIRERLALGESWVRCDDCGMTTDMFGSHERAIAAWNRRPAPPSLPADGDGALRPTACVPTEGDDGHVPTDDEMRRAEVVSILLCYASEGGTATEVADQVIAALSTRSLGTKSQSDGVDQ